MSFTFSFSLSDKKSKQNTAWFPLVFFRFVSPSVMIYKQDSWGQMLESDRIGVQKTLWSSLPNTSPTRGLCITFFVCVCAEVRSSGFWNCFSSGHSQVNLYHPPYKWPVLARLQQGRIFSYQKYVFGLGGG